MTNQEKASKILELVGGKENISYATFCMTRLRLTPKDKGLVKDEDTKTVPILFRDTLTLRCIRLIHGIY